MASKLYTFSDVSPNNHSTSCWLIISGKVYDVTEFLMDHPGGEDAMLSSTGKDATYDFEDVGHSNSALALMDKYCIGDIDISTLPKQQEYIPPKLAAHTSAKASDLFMKILQVTVPLAILGFAASLQILVKGTQ